MNSGDLRHFDAEREAIVREIHDAFLEVMRHGGVSWSESEVIDSRGSNKAREQARALDTDKYWQDLVDDPTWRHEVGVGGFSFLDPIGWRYYIAPAMIRCLREGDAQRTLSTLQSSFHRTSSHSRAVNISARQSKAIGLFLQLMSKISLAVFGEIESEYWQDAYGDWQEWDRSRFNKPKQ